MDMNIRNLEKKAEEVKKGVRYVYTHRRLPLAEISNPAVSECLAITEMLDAIRVDSESGDSGNSNIRKADLDDIYDDLSEVISISSHIPSLRAVWDVFKVEAGDILPKREAFDGLSEEFVLNEFSWRLDRLVCGLYSLPRKVTDDSSNRGRLI